MLGATLAAPHDQHADPAPRGNYFSPTHHTVVFITTLFGIALISLLASISTRLVVRFMTTLMLFATAGLVVDL